MNKVSRAAIVVVAYAAGMGPSFAMMGGAGHADPSASMRRKQAICEEQKRGEYPRYHNACLPDEMGAHAEPYSYEQR